MNYKEVIESKYDRQAWQLLLHDIFHGNDTFYNSPASVAVSSHLAKQALLLGKLSLRRSDPGCLRGRALR